MRRLRWWTLWRRYWRARRYGATGRTLHEYLEAVDNVTETRFGTWEDVRALAQKDNLTKPGDAK